MGSVSDLALMPRPKQVSVPGGAPLRIDRQSLIDADPELLEPARKLAHYLSWVIGDEPSLGGGGNIRFRISPEAHGNSEWYRIDVDASTLTVTATTSLGALHAVQTIRQLVEPSAFARTAESSEFCQVPQIQIEDWPELVWRGAHLDVARHFMPIDFLHRFVELIAMHKLNRLHLHLTDDQGWRLDVPQYPRLVSVGSKRAGTVLSSYRSDGWEDSPPHDNVPHEGFYSHADMIGLISHAASLGVEVLPEIDLPGHMQAALEAYPWLRSCEHEVVVATGWSVSPHVMSVSDEALEFCRDVLDYVAELFPFRYIHLGGDEVPKDEWEKSPVAQKRIRSEGLQNEDELQAWFLAQLVDHLATKGKSVIGWDEVLEGGVPAGVTVMSWRGDEGGIQAAQMGHDVIMAPTHSTYFDYHQAFDANDPPALGHILDLDIVRNFVPIPASLSVKERTHILGAQFQLWTERMTTPARVEFMAFPRAAVFADVVWGGMDRVRDSDAVIDAHLERLDDLNVNYRRVELR